MRLQLFQGQEQQVWTENRLPGVRTEEDLRGLEQVMPLGRMHTKTTKGNAHNKTIKLTWIPYKGKQHIRMSEVAPIT